MKFLSLFSGIGGLDLGLERSGMTCMAQVEKSEYCRKVLAKHWPGVNRYEDVIKFCRRITDCEPENDNGEVICPRCRVEFGECECIGTDQFIDECGTPEIIVGGDPCQDNSNSCRSSGAIEASIGGEFIRIVEQLGPKFVLRENPSVVRADAPWPWTRFRSELERLDFQVISFRLRACCVGADFRRDRLFLFAEHASAKRKRLERNECEELAREGGWRQNADTARSNRWNATPRICGRVDGISNRMDRLKSLGNAVAPAVGEFIGRRIMELVK